MTKQDDKTLFARRRVAGAILDEVLPFNCGTVAWLSKEVCGTVGDQYQAMVSEETDLSAGDGLAFHHWVLETFRDNWHFDSPESAALNFIRRYKQWLSIGKPVTNTTAKIKSFKAQIEEIKR